MDEYGTAEIKHAHHRSAAGIKVQRQRDQRALVIAQSLGDGIVDRAQRVGFVIDLTTLGKTGCAGRDHDQKQIFAVHRNLRIIGRYRSQRLFIRRIPGKAWVFDGQ